MHLEMKTHLGTPSRDFKTHVMVDGPRNDAQVGKDVERDVTAATNGHEETTQPTSMVNPIKQDSLGEAAILSSRRGTNELINELIRFGLQFTYGEYFQQHLELRFHWAQHRVQHMGSSTRVPTHGVQHMGII